jgi:hypothetical protein
VGYLIPIAAIISLFSFLSVASWASARFQERAAYYKSEMLKKIVESQGPGATAALEYLREQERNAELRRQENERKSLKRDRDGLRLGGLLTAVVGVCLMIFLHVLVSERGVYLVGLIPLGVGLVLLFFSYFWGPPERG